MLQTVSDGNILLLPSVSTVTPVTLPTVTPATVTACVDGYT